MTINQMVKATGTQEVYRTADKNGNNFAVIKTEKAFAIVRDQGDHDSNVRIFDRLFKEESKAIAKVQEWAKH